MVNFYPVEKSHLIPNEILIPSDIDEIAVQAVVDKILLSLNEEKRNSRVNLAQLRMS